MKKLSATLLLILILVSAESFKGKRRMNLSNFKRDGYFTAVVDGKMFVTRDENKYTADLVNKTSDAFWDPMMVKTTLPGVTNSTTFFGNQFFDASGNLCEERINFSYTFNEGATGESANPVILMHYNNDKYYNLPENTKLKITKLMWSQDRRYCVVNADFDVKMRRWGVPAENQPVVRLKGHMENINVSCPATLAQKKS